MAGTSVLQSAGILKPGESLASSNGRYKAVNQTDFNFCVYKFDEATWASGTWKQGLGNLIMQADGNLVLYDTEGSGKAKWASNTAGKGTGPYQLVMQNDGNLVIYDHNYAPTWATNTNAPSQLTSRGTLKPGDSLVSPNLIFSAVNQFDFNFCVYKGNEATWASGTWKKGLGDLIMQEDGNLVLYDTQGDGKPKWASQTGGVGTAPFRLVMQNDGNLVIYDAHSTATWSTKTNVPSQLVSRGTLHPGGLIVSPNMTFCAINQFDFNFCVYKQIKATWASGTWKKGLGDLIMQEDGNLVLYDTQGDGKPKWASQTGGVGKGPYKLVMQDDGNLVIYDSTRKATWATNTNE